MERTKKVFMGMMNPLWYSAGEITLKASPSKWIPENDDEVQKELNVEKKND